MEPASTPEHLTAHKQPDDSDGGFTVKASVQFLVDLIAVGSVVFILWNLPFKCVTPLSFIIVPTYV